MDQYTGCGGCFEEKLAGQIQGRYFLRRCRVPEFATIRSEFQSNPEAYGIDQIMVRLQNIVEERKFDKVQLSPVHSMVLDKEEWIKKIKCYGCKQYGHFRRNCPNKRVANNMNRRDGCKQKEDSKEKFCFMSHKAKISKHIAITSNERKERKEIRFCVDSGATDHCVWDINLVNDFIPGEIEVNVAGKGQ